MILDNRTSYASADLERIILGALQEFGITKHARERVVVKPYASYSGWCFFGHVQIGKRARMTIRIPTSELDVARLVWLVRHEVGHWAGLEHTQMGTALRYWHRKERGRRRPIDGPVGCERPIPDWATGLTVSVAPATATETPTPTVIPARRRAPDADALRADRLEHARLMLAKAERKAKTAAMLIKRWRRRVGAAERAIERARSKAVAA